MGIAQDLFFHPSDYNWYQADPGGYLQDWSVKSRTNYEKELQQRPALSNFEFFVEDDTSWKRTQCSLSYNNTCANLPPPDFIQQQHSRHRARSQLYAMEAHRLSLEQGSFVIQVITSAKERLDG